VVKFDLSSVTTINNAKLRLYGALSTASGGSVTTGVYVASNVWDENTVTWNTRPGIGPNPYVTTVLTGTINQWYEWDVTSYLQSEKANGINTVTFVIKNPSAATASAIFNSDDASANQPQIVVT
jgi:endoglucanase